MAVLALAAWMLALLFSVVVASWSPGGPVVAAPLVVAGAGFVAAWFARRGAPRFAAHDAPGAGRPPDWARAIVQEISTPSLTVEGGVVEVANQAFLALLDYRDRSDQVVGLPFANLLHPADHDLFVNLVVVASQKNASGADGRVRLACADGSLVKVQVSVSPLQGGTGRLLVQLAPGQAPAGGAVRPDDLGTLVDQLDWVVFKTDGEGRIDYVNQAWERLTGRTADQSRGLRLVSTLHPDDRRSVDDPLRDIGHGRLDQLSVEVRLVMDDGNVVWVLLRARGCTQPDGELAGISGTLFEITRRKHLEATLGSTRRYFNTLLANVPGMVYRCRNDPDWTMEFVSDGCVELTGYEPYELVENARISFARLIHAQDREFVWTHVQRQLALHEPYQLSYRILDAQQRQRWVWEQARGVFSAHGELLAIEGFITDITERQGAAEQARRRLWFEARTGMLGRALFDTLLAFVWQHAQIAGYPYALFVVDLIDFNALAERWGADKGEQALDQIARRFATVNAPGTVVTYLGANQFALLVTDFRVGGATRAAPDMRELIPAASAMAERLVQVLSQSVMWGDARASAAVAVGIAIGDARYVGATAVLQAARTAAAQAAELGAGRCEFADE